MSGLDLLPRVTPERKTAPPKRWRNRFVARCPHWIDMRINGKLIRDGEEFVSDVTFPSAEIAEQKALEDIARVRLPAPFTHVVRIEWVRAEPVE